MKTAPYGLRLSYTITLTLMLSVFAVVANAAEFTARATGVTDGDTLTVLTGNNVSLRIRLVEIDAPESDQPWGANAKQALSALVLGQSVRVVSTGQDEYGRTLARIFVNGKDVNAEMVRTGSAWAYRHYLTDTSLLAMERDAQNVKRGLWALPVQQRIAPSQWRAERQAIAASRVPSPAASQQCAAKHVCRQMTSCSEAKFYLNTCGIRSLDGDHDGVPCENLCR